MARRRGRRSSRRSSGTDWGNILLWGLGIGAGIFVVTGIAGVSVLKSVADSQPQPTLPNAQQFLDQAKFSL